MHGSAHGQNNVGDLLGDAGLLSHFHVGGYSRNGGAGAEGNGRGSEQMLPHYLRAALAAAEAGVYREEDEHINEAQNIVDDESTAVVTDEVGAVGGDEIGEEAEEADRCVVGDDLYDLHDAVGQVVKYLRGQGLFAAGHLDAEAEENCGYDEGQDSPAAPELCKVRLGEEVDNHIRNSESRADLALSDLIGTGGYGDHADDYVHDDCGDGCGHKEGRDGNAHDLAGSLRAGHIRDSRGYGAEDHRYDYAEHEVYEYCSERLKNGCALGYDLS